jgi:hypothetical protein
VWQLLGVVQIQNGGRCHGNQGAKNVKFTSVSSISVWRVTCYDHFCVFNFFSIFAISMATAAILKKSTLYSTTSHGSCHGNKKGGI